MENKRYLREKRSFRYYTLKDTETRMRAKDFGTPLEGARSAKNKEYILK